MLHRWNAVLRELRARAGGCSAYSITDFDSAVVGLSLYAIPETIEALEGQREQVCAAGGSAALFDTMPCEFLVVGYSVTLGRVAPHKWDWSPRDPQIKSRDVAIDSELWAPWEPGMAEPAPELSTRKPTWRSCTFKTATARQSAARWATSGAGWCWRTSRETRFL